jgi:DNA-binding SARP family transcriptional activator
MADTGSTTVGESFGMSAAQGVPEQVGAWLSLLGGFRLSCGGSEVSLPLSAQRVLAFLALSDRGLHRPYVAGSIWANSPEERSSGSLRSALWRVRSLGRSLVVASDTHLSLAPDVCVDYREGVRIAHIWLDGSASVDSATDVRRLLSTDLLPDWYDDWVVLERERFHQLRTYALEAACVRLTSHGRYAEAVLAGQAAVAAEPLRESAHRALVEAQIAEGNRGEAIRQYQRYREILRCELGLQPSSAMERLVCHLPV